MAEGYKRQNVGAPILHALVELGGSADRQKIKEQIVDDSTNELTYEDVFEPITSKKGNQYIPFNFDFNFGIQELLHLGYIENYSRKGDIVLTEKGRLVNIDLYPNKKEQEQIKKEYWEKIQENEEINKRIENIKSGEYKDLIKAMAISNGAGKEETQGAARYSFSVIYYADTQEFNTSTMLDND